MAAKRSSLPLRVHQIWDAILSISGKDGKEVDYDKLQQSSASLHNIPSSEFSRDLNDAISDGLVIMDKTGTYKLPDPVIQNKGDHDWYCFKCHLGGIVVQCEDCPRVYHNDCIPEERKPDKDLFVCPPCHLKESKPSAEKLNLKQNKLNQLLDYICKRFKDWEIPFLENAEGKTWAVATNRAPKEAWRFNYLIHIPIDLSSMVSKASSALYTSLEEFQVDCETLVHNIGVYFGIDQLKGNNIGGAFNRDAFHDIQEILLCHDCFRRSNEKEHPWWFCLPCATPHEVVWAKQSGYPFWPAKVMKHEGTRYDVRYFGGSYERGSIDQKNIKDIDTSIANLKVRKNAAWNDAFEELQKFQEIAKNPEKVNSLPSRGKQGGGNKRSSNANNDEVVAKKSKNSTPKSASSQKSLTNSSGPAKRGRKPGSSVVRNGVPSSGSSTPNSQPQKKKTLTKSSSSSTTTPVSSRQESQSTINKSSSTNSSQDTNLDKEDSQFSLGTGTDGTELLDYEDFSFLDNEFSDDEDEIEVLYSDDESNSLQDKVSEEYTVSSSCADSKKVRNAYVQVATQKLPLSGYWREKVMKQMGSLKEKLMAELSISKKKQWCYNCEREAIYHCCWNTAYCSIDCQQAHWAKEHKRLCRRNKGVMPKNEIQ